MTSSKVYAQPTFIERKLYATNNNRSNPWLPNDSTIGQYAEEYSSRGWTHVQINQRETLKRKVPVPFQGTRMLVDSRTWIMNLRTDGIKQFRNSESVLEASSWDFGLGTRKQHVDFSEDPHSYQRFTYTKDVHASDFTHPALQHTHTFPRTLDPEGPNRRTSGEPDDWTNFATAKLDAVLIGQTDYVEPKFSIKAMSALPMMSLDKRNLRRATQQAKKKSGSNQRTKNNLVYECDDKLVEWFKEWTALSKNS